MSMAWFVPLTIVAFAAPASAQTGETAPVAGVDLASALTRAKAVDGAYTPWREHIVDDEAPGGV